MSKTPKFKPGDLIIHESPLRTYIGRILGIDQGQYRIFWKNEPREELQLQLWNVKIIDAFYEKAVK